MKEVIIFSSNTWGYCEDAKKWMKDEGIVYTEKNINKDPEARKELIQSGYMGVPVFYIGDEVVQGFDKSKIASLVK